MGTPFIPNPDYPDATDDELWQQIRHKRNIMLKQTDHTQVLDSHFTNPAWKTYRQQLRDIPQTFTNPRDVEFPDDPA